MKKIGSLLFCTISLLFSNSYEVTNIPCDEKLSVRFKADEKSHAFYEISCNKKNIKLIRCEKNDKKYQWCKVSFKFEESTLVGWVYNKYIKETVPKNKVQKKNKVEKLLKLAKAYYFGTKLHGQNYEKAKKVFLKASKKNSVVAYRYLGTMYLFGHGTDIDKEKAKKWLMKAIDLNDTSAQKVYAKYFLHL
ncbi:MAG: hypothetical protein DSZ07_03200 [Sulfurovum sp.]|nr:MAG: hypothetical protein DSZ07_03200 [Sulfurovum sp.]